MKSFKNYLTAGVGFAMLVTIILLATGWGSAVAAQISSVIVTNDAAHAVPVRDQNTDANGNIKVHEQGTASVNVTNTTLAVHDLNTTQGTNFTINGFSDQAIDVSGYKQIRIMASGGTCDPNATANFGIIAVEGGHDFLLGTTPNLCGQIYSQVFDVPGRTIEIGCSTGFSFCDGQFSVPVVVFGRNN
jgi:hypothetical protein